MMPDESGQPSDIREKARKIDKGYSYVRDRYFFTYYVPSACSLSSNCAWHSCHHSSNEHTEYLLLHQQARLVSVHSEKNYLRLC